MDEELYSIEQKADVTIMKLMLDMILIDENEKLKKAYADLVAAGNRFIVLDLANTTYISSLVLASFVYMQKMVRDAGGNMVLCGVQKKVKEVLEATNLDKIIGIVADQDEAIRTLLNR